MNQETVSKFKTWYESPVWYEPYDTILTTIYTALAFITMCAIWYTVLTK